MRKLYEIMFHAYITLGVVIVSSFAIGLLISVLN